MMPQIGESSESITEPQQHLKASIDLYPAPYTVGRSTVSSIFQRQTVYGIQLTNLVDPTSFAGECANHPVGISDSFIIPDGNIVATSAEAGLEAPHARMSDDAAWCFIGSADLTIDLGESVEVCAIETRGYNDSSIERSTSVFSLQFSADGSTYTNYEENGNQRVRTNDDSRGGPGGEQPPPPSPPRPLYIKSKRLDG